MYTERQGQIAETLTMHLRSGQPDTKFVVSNPETIIMNGARMTGRLFHLVINADKPFSGKVVENAVLRLLHEEGVNVYTDDHGHHIVLERWSEAFQQYHELITTPGLGYRCNIGLALADGTSGKGVAVEGSKAFFVPYEQEPLELRPVTIN